MNRSSGTDSGASSGAGSELVETAAEPGARPDSVAAGTPVAVPELDTQPLRTGGGEHPSVPTTTHGGRRAETVPSESDLYSPLVGRKSELDAIRAAIRSAVDFQTPELVTVIGSQGTGKSRLVAEICDEIAGDVRVIVSRAAPGGSRHQLVGNMLRERFGITKADSRSTIVDKIRTTVESTFRDKRVFEVVHYLGWYLGIEFPESPFLRLLGEAPGQHDDVARTVLRRFLELDASETPLALVFEDLHLANDESLAMLQELGRGLGGCPIVVIAVARSELTVRLAGWGEGVTEHRLVELRNLEPELAAEMFGNLLRHCGPIENGIVEDAVAMTGGNPAFVTQLVRLLLDNGTIDTDSMPWRIDADKAAATELPFTIEEAIEARIGALDARERAVLEKGAAFGNVFWLGAVVAMGRIAADLDDLEVSGDSDAVRWNEHGDEVRRSVVGIISDLVDSDYLLMLDPEDSSIPGDVELVFKHNLECELISKSTNPESLAEYHRLAAQWYETKITERTDEQLEYLGQLFADGGESARAAYCFLNGADKARNRFANEQAIELYERGLDLLGSEDALARLNALHNLGDVYQRAGRIDDALAAFRRMLAVAWRFEAYGKGGAAQNRIGRVYRSLGRYDEAMTYFTSAQELFERQSDSRGVAGCLGDIGGVHYLRGAYQLALDHHRRALSVRRGIGDPRSIALSLGNIGRIHRDTGSFTAAISQFNEALALRRQIGDQAGVIQSLSDLGETHLSSGNLEVAHAIFEEAHALASETGDALAMIATQAMLGSSLMASADLDAAEAMLSRAADEATRFGSRWAIADSQRRLAELLLLRGRLEEARAAADKAEEMASSAGVRIQVAMTARVLGELAAREGTPQALERAEQHFMRAVDILAAMKNEFELSSCYLAFADLRERQGQGRVAATLRQRAGEIRARLAGATTA